MNKIFKVIWSKSKNCYVVVSEFAKNNSGKKKIVVAAILAALAMTNASISMASNDVPAGLPASAVGLGPSASVKGDKAVGFGYKASAAGGNSVVIGSNASVDASSPQGIAIGGGNQTNEGARVIGEQAIAIGGNTIAQGNSSIVIGGDDVVKADGVKVIYTTSDGATQTGDLRTAVQSLTGFDMKNPLYTTATAGESGITLGMKGQSGNVGIAIGTGANAKDRLVGTDTGATGQANKDVTNAIAIGTGARANRDNAIAIGGGSNTDVGGTKQSSYTLPNNVVASWAGGDKTLPGDVVSFGSKGYERQLKHVAPGEVSATSTDAINGSQLSALVDQVTYKYISIKSTDAGNKDNTGATAPNSIAIGPNAVTDASASRSVAVGDGASGKVVDGVAIGSKSTADIASGVAGYNINASRTDTYAGLSGATLTSKLGGVAVGTTNQTRQINYVAAGTADTDAVNVAQLKSVNLAFTGDTGTGDVNLANSKLAVNGDNTYITTTANGKKITVSGKKQDITVANGSATATAGMADSANVANAINQAINQNKYGWNLSANGEATPVAVEKGNTVDFSGDDNVTVARNDKKISVALKKDLSKLNSASFNNAGGNETVKIDGDKGINAGNLKVTNVTDGIADKDAVNVSQLKKVDDKAEANKTAIDTNKTAIAKNAGDIATNKADIAINKDNIATNKQKIADNKTAIDKNSGDIATNKTDIATNKDNIADNKQKIADNKAAIDKNVGDIATNKANIAQNTTAIARKISLGGNSGSTDEKSLSTGDVKFNVKGENGLTTVANGDDVTVKLDDATKGKVDNAADRDLNNLTPDGKQQVKDLAAWNVVANNETAEKVEGGNTVKFIDGDNISITQNGKDFTISTKKDVTFDTVTATQTITAPKVKATTGVETPQVTGLTNTAWVPGQTQPVSGRAATEDQLKKVDDQVAENKANIADNTDKIGKNADAIADNKQKIADNKTAIDKNAGDIATNKTDIATNKDNIAANKQKITDNKTAIDKNVGDIATNKANIAQNTTAIARKISLGGNSGSTDEKSLSTGDVKFNVKGENGLTTVANGDDVTVKLDDATKGKVDNAADRDLSNLTPDGKQQVKDLAAWNVVANNETAEKVEGGNTVKFIDGDNISITQNGKDFTISTKKDVTFDTVTAIQTITAPKVKATTGVETPQVTGLTNTAWVPGQTQPVSGRAATEDQLKHVDDQVAENKTNIADNTDKIGKNADAIADNKQKIADNKTAIDKNSGDIATNKTDIATNKDNIADNKQKIADNKAAIDKNAGDIATNKTDIATNKDNIAANKQKIADNKTAIDKNTGDIATNKADISTNKDNIATNKANIDKNTIAISRKISLGGNTGSTDEKSLSTGDVKFNVKGENGLTTVANGDDVTVKLDDTTKGKIDNAADRDLSNLTPDGKQQVKDLAAWNVVANNETAEKVEGGNTVKFIDGDNISITQNGKDFTISTKKDVTFDTVTANQTITAPKVKATTGVETPQVTGLTNITWVPGQTQPVSGRGATEDQLKKVDDQVAENKANIADNTDKIGKNADAIADNKQKIADNKTAIDKNVGDIATNKANIAQNTAAIARKISLGGNSGSTDEKSLSTGDVKFNVKGENGLTTVANGDDVTVKLDDTTKGKIDNAADRDLSNLTPDGKQQVKDLAAWNVVANNETAEKVEGGNTVKFIDGDNISITQNGKDFTISTKKDVTFDTVTATQTITAPKVKATTGVETPQVTGLTNTAWVPGQTQPVSGRAATEDQLKKVDDQVAENKTNIADNTDKIGKNADAIADNKQKIADNKTAIDKNAGDIAINKTDIATNKDNIAANKQKIADNKTAIDKNAGDIAINKADIATNKANIDKNTTAIARKISLGGNSGSTNEKSLSTGDVKFNVKGENGLTTVANGDDVTVKLDDATKGKVDNAADRDLSNLTPDGKQQVKDLSAWNVVANNETAEKVEGGNTVKFIDGDNISITQNGKDFTVSTKKDVAFDTVTATQTITAPKVKATTGVETPQVTGLTNTTWVPGQTQPVSGRAATEDQLKKVDDQVAENKANIADNTDKIGKNADAIADNKQKIADNKTAIDKNAGDIATNKTDIATNKDNIADNKQKIADNKTAIDKNAGNIATNKADIATNKDNIDKNTTAIARKISLGGNSGSTDAKSLSTGDVKFNVKGENGLTTVANGDDVTVKLDDATKGKIDNAADRDLSNLTPDGKQQVKDLAAWNVVANNETAEKVEGGNTVKFIDGDNISITQNGKDFTVSTKKDVTFDTVTATQTITAPKVKATTGVETPQVTGLTNTTWVPGQTQPVSGRAATEDQLKQVDDQVAENKANIADNTDKIGKNAKAIADNKQKIADNKAAIDRNAADIATNKDNIADNKAAITKNAGDIAINKANIDKNTEAIARKISLGGNTGSTDEKSLSTGDVKFNIKGQNGIVTEANGEDVTVKLDDATANKINNAANTDLSNLTDTGKQQVKDLSAWNVVANGNTAEKVEGGNTVKFIDGDNISITQNGKDFTIATKQDVTFNTVKANQTITAPKVKATEGVETPQVTGLTNKEWISGQTQSVSGRAATEDQLKQVDNQVAENKANIADNKDKISKNTADIAANKGNISTNKQDIADNKAAITKNTGDIATNKANIDKNTESIARKISLGGNTGSTDEKSLSTGDVKFNVKGENGLTTVANGDDVTVKLDDVTKGKIDNAANQDLSNLTDAGKQKVKDISAWNVTAAGGTVEKVQGGDTVKFQAGDNLVVNQDRTAFTYGLAKDLKGLNSVTVGDENGVSTKITPAGTTVKDAAGNSTVIKGGGMTITPADVTASPVSLTVDGLNNGGNQIHGVAPGTDDTDAVNVSQLKASNAGLQEAVNRVGTETQRVGAHAAAMAALKPIQYDPLEPTQIMAGIGNYRGETAGAIGIAHYRTEDTMFNVGVSLGTSHNMVNAGVTHKFGGSRERKEAIPERYKAGPISSVYVMQDEVSSLKKENSNQKTVIANQAARLNTLEAENERQRQELAETKQGLDELRAVVNQLLASKG